MKRCNKLLWILDNTDIGLLIQSIVLVMAIVCMSFIGG